MGMPYKGLKNNFKVNFDSAIFLSGSSLPEVTIEDEGKMLIVEDGKWVIKTFDGKIEVDSTLTKPGMAADADAAGRRLRELELAVSNLPKPTKEDANKCLRVNALGEWEILPIEETVQADWNQTDDTKNDFIKNKPNVLTEEKVKDMLAPVAASGSFNDLIHKPSIVLSLNNEGVLCMNVIYSHDDTESVVYDMKEDEVGLTVAQVVNAKVNNKELEVS